MSWVQWFKCNLRSKLPVCVGLVSSDVGERLGTDFLYVDRGYWDRYNSFRVIRGGIHLQKIIDRPADRLKYAEMRPWHKRGSYVVVVPPSKYQCERIPGAADWLANLKLETDREIRVKTDKSLPFDAYIKDAWCVVSYGSVAAVKAAMWGYPVLSGPHCPALPIDCESIESPVYKDREPWLRSLSYAQWQMSEVDVLLKDHYYLCES